MAFLWPIRPIQITLPINRAPLVYSMVRETAAPDTWSNTYKRKGKKALGKMKTTFSQKDKH